MDLAKVRYFQALLGPDLSFKGETVVIVNVNCDFCAPTFFDDEIEVETAITELGDKSLTLEQRVFSPADGRVRCRCRTIMAGFDTRTMTSVPVSDTWRRAIKAYEGDVPSRVK